MSPWPAGGDSIDLVIVAIEAATRRTCGVPGRRLTRGEAVGLLDLLVPPHPPATPRVVFHVGDLDFATFAGSADAAPAEPNEPSPDPLVAEVRRRDGDNCRWCGRRVYWSPRGAASGTYDHLRPGVTARSADDLVVACYTCNFDRPTWRMDERPLPGPPARPFYGVATRRLLDGCTPTTHTSPGRGVW